MGEGETQWERAKVTIAASLSLSYHFVIRIPGILILINIMILINTFGIHICNNHHMSHIMTERTHVHRLDEDDDDICKSNTSGISS